MPSDVRKLVTEAASKFPGLSRSELARKLMAIHPGRWISIEACRSSVRRILGDNNSSYDPIQDEIKRQARDRTNTEIVKSVKEVAFREFLASLVKDVVIPFPEVKYHKSSKQKGHTREALLVFTDWHFDELVSLSGTMGLNEYNSNEACKRVYRIVSALRDWKRDAESGKRFSIKKLTILLIGDMVSGSLHGIEKHTDSQNVVMSALRCGDLVSMAIRDIAEDFDSVQVVGVPGNHGRLPDERKVPTKDPARSWDRLIYEVSKRRLHENKKITWYIPDSYCVAMQVAGWWCFASHGNFIPNNLGVVGYGVRRFTSAMANNLGVAGKPIRYAFYGHWHNSSSAEFAGVEAHICPSLIGTQEYSLNSGGNISRSAQSLFLFDEHLGLTTQERLYGIGPGYDGAYIL